MNRLGRISFPWKLAVLVAMVGLVALVGTRPGAAGPGGQGYRGVPGETLIGGVLPSEEAAQQTDLHRWLMSQAPSGVFSAPLLVGLTEAERKDLAKRQDAANGPAVVGRTKMVSEVVRFSDADGALLSPNPRRVGPGFLSATPDGGFVWAAAVVAEGAAAIRVHLSGLRLPDDSDLFFFNRSGQAFGPYTRSGPNGDGAFWTNTLFGSEGVILLRHYGPNGAADLKGTSFVLQEVGHIGSRFADGLGISPESFCSFNVACIENASCHNGTPADPAKSAVALMQWIQGAFIYTCTGGLIADSDGASQIPYFLTANHCLSSNSVAQNLETYFQFSLSCGSTNCPGQTNPGGIQRLGATVMTSGTGGDFTLLRLNQTPPGGSVFLGWNNTPVANTNGAALYRISHPAWAPQAYSADTVSTSAPTCTGWPRGERIYSRTNTGGTEGGSSGSPVLNSSSQIVGQLSGACGTNVNNECDHVNNATVDGAFAFYWTSVQPYLGTTCVPTTEICNDGIDNDCDTAIDCADSNCAGSPFCPSCTPVGGSCTVNANCCSNKCKGPAGRKTCR